MTTFFAAFDPKPHDPLAKCHQALVVLTDSWDASSGKMFLLERDNRSAWQRHEPEMPVLIGKSGLAWGRGIVDTASFAGPVKKEGDDKAPAGIYRLGSAFGQVSASEATFLKMSYLPLSEKIVAIDDPQSRYYNQIVDESKIEKRDWQSAEKMFGVAVYKWGVVIEHNLPAKAGAGSCIFLHIWENETTATSGCTVMSEADLIKVMRWLDPAQQPLLVQLPQPEYEKLQEKWNLPNL